MFPLIPAKVGDWRSRISHPRAVADLEERRHHILMPLHLFTIICEFRGGTYCSQLRADNEVDAVRRWATKIAAERPISRASGYIAKAALRDLPPAALEGLANAWCFTPSVGSDLALCTLVMTADPDR